MKAVEIRSLAKAIRNNESTMGYEEMEAFLLKAFDYVKENSSKWTDKFSEQIESALDEIQNKVDELALEKKEEIPEENPVEVPVEMAEEKKEASPVEKPDDDFPVRRYGFKTVQKRMASEGMADPILSAIQWFAVVYAGDSYNTQKCVNGMLERRGYGISGEGNDFVVFNNGKHVANFTVDNGKVESFNIL